MLKHILVRYLQKQFLNMVLGYIFLAFLGRDHPQLISKKSCRKYFRKTPRESWEICGKKILPKILQRLPGSNAVFKNMLKHIFWMALEDTSGKTNVMDLLGSCLMTNFGRCFPKYSSRKCRGNLSFNVYWIFFRHTSQQVFSIQKLCLGGYISPENSQNVVFAFGRDIFQKVAGNMFFLGGITRGFAKQIPPEEKVDATPPHSFSRNIFWNTNKTCWNIFCGDISRNNSSNILLDLGGVFHKVFPTIIFPPITDNLITRAKKIPGRQGRWLKQRPVNSLLDLLSSWHI